MRVADSHERSAVKRDATRMAHGRRDEEETEDSRGRREEGDKEGRNTTTGR